MAKKKYTDAAGLSALLARIRQKFVSYALAEDLVSVQESLAQAVDEVNEKVEANTTKLEAKASLSQLSVLQATVNGHKTQIDNLSEKHMNDLAALNNADVALQENIDTAKEGILTTHDDQMRRLAFHIGLPEYSVTQMMAWKNIAECWGKYKDDTQLEIWPRVDMSGVVNAGSFFQGAVNLTKVWPMNTSAMTAAATMFLGCNALREVDAIDLSSCTDMRSMFYQCTALESVNITKMDAATVKVRGMFQDCPKLREVALPCTAVTEDADVMFYGCSTLRRVSLGALLVRRAKQMFAKCYELEIIEGTIDVGLCEDASLMFQACWRLAQVTIDMIGAAPDIRTWDFSAMQHWGDPDRSEECRLSLLESMSHAVNYGDDPVTLSFHADTKARLEDAGLIASLTEKGFTIA